MKVSLDEKCQNWMKVFWMTVSLDEIVFGWKCQWMKSSLDESVFYQWACGLSQTCPRSALKPAKAPVAQKKHIKFQDFFFPIFFCRGIRKYQERICFFPEPATRKKQETHTKTCFLFRSLGRPCTKTRERMMAKFVEHFRHNFVQLVFFFFKKKSILVLVPPRIVPTSKFIQFDFNRSKVTWMNVIQQSFSWTHQTNWLSFFKCSLTSNAFLNFIWLNYFLVRPIAMWPDSWSSILLSWILLHFFFWMKIHSLFFLISWFFWITCGDKRNQQHEMNVITILSHLISKGVWHPIMIKADRSTSTSVQSKQDVDFVHTRTSPPWIQHRDLKLCHDDLFQTCLIHSAPHPTNARSFIVLVTPFPLCHHHQTTLTFPHRESWLCHGPNGSLLRTRLCSIPRVSLPAYATRKKQAFLVQLGISIEYSFPGSTRPSNRECQKISRALFSRRYCLWTTLHRRFECGLWLRSWIRTCSQRHQQQNRKSHPKHDRRRVQIVWFPLMMAMRRNICTSVSRQRCAFNICTSCHRWSPEYHEKLHVFLFPVGHDLGSGFFPKSCCWAAVQPLVLLSLCTLPVVRCRSNTAHTAKQSHSNCDGKHNVLCPFVILNRPFPFLHSDNSSVRNHQQVFSSPSLRDHHSRALSHIVQCDPCPGGRSLYHCFMCTTQTVSRLMKQRLVLHTQHHHTFTTARSNSDFSGISHPNSRPSLWHSWHCSVSREVFRDFFSR